MPRKAVVRSAVTAASVCLATVTIAGLWDVTTGSRPSPAAASAAAVVVVALGTRRLERLTEGLLARRDPRERARAALLDAATSFAAATTSDATLDALPAAAAGRQSVA